MDARDKMRDLEATENASVVDNSTQLYDAWVEANPWFTEDNGLRYYALGIGQELINEKAQEVGGVNKLTNAQIKEIYEDVTEKTKEQYPDKFAVKKKVTTVNTPSRRASVKSSTKKDEDYTFDDLPEEAQQMGKRFASKGLFTKEEYVKNYRAGGGKFKGEE